MTKQQKIIKVQIDKSHLLTLGEQMYGESIELVRELVNNAYDADATEVHISVGPESITVEDNGSGMSEKGLAQFFTVGSQEKRLNSRSPKFGRKRIGQFGIGKFAALSAADQFIVESKKGNWVHRVIFDRDDWQKSDKWELPISKEPATTFDHNGTKVILTKLRKHFTPKDIKKYLHESIPLRAKKFAVYLNEIRITKKEIIGRKFTVNLKTGYGLIEGEIIIALNTKDINGSGVVCRVKQVLVKRELFGLENRFSSQLLNRVCGEVNADFLPVLASRSDFIRDSNEYRIFYKIMNHFLFKILEKLKQESKVKNLKKISKQLKEVLLMVREALELNPDFVPKGKAVARLKKQAQKAKQERTKKEKNQESFSKEKPAEEKPKADLITPEVNHRIRLKKLGVSVGVVSLGEQAEESFAEGNLIYINQDHPLYKKFILNQELFALHLARLITKEIILMKRLRITARQAYEYQSKLLTDVFVKKLDM